MWRAKMRQLVYHIFSFHHASTLTFSWHDTILKAGHAVGSVSLQL